METFTIGSSNHNAAGMTRALHYAGGLLGDLRVAFRSLRRTPSLWATVALTLALGIGMNTAIFSVVRGVLLRPLMNRDEDRLIYIQQSAPGLQVSNATFSVPEVTDIGAHLKMISRIGTFSTIDFSAEGLGEVREIHAGVVDGAYFDVMGLKPVLGRLLDERDDGQNAPGAVVLTYKFWATVLHSDPKVIGKSIRLGSMMEVRSATVVGVLEPSVPYPAATELIANIVTEPTPSLGHHGARPGEHPDDRHIRPLGARGDAELRAGRTSRRVRHHDGGLHTGVYKPQHHYQIDARLLRDQINSEATTILWLLFGARRACCSLLPARMSRT